MKVIVFASSKGGVGKTTLCFNTGIVSARTKGVLLCDLDPQRSLLDLCARRRHVPELSSDDPVNPMILDNAESVANAVRVLTETGYDRDFLLVDTPGSFMNIIRDAIANADCVVVPLQPSPMDVLATDPVIEMIGKLDKRDRTLVVLNRVDARTTLPDAMLERLEPLSPHPVVKIAQRVDYARAVITARAGAELNKAAAAEIAGLWRCIEDVMRKADEQQAKHLGRKRPETVRARQ